MSTPEDAGIVKAEGNQNESTMTTNNDTMVINEDTVKTEGGSEGGIQNDAEKTSPSTSPNDPKDVASASPEPVGNQKNAKSTGSEFEAAPFQRSWNSLPNQPSKREDGEQPLTVANQTPRYSPIDESNNNEATYNMEEKFVMWSAPYMEKLLRFSGEEGDAKARLTNPRELTTVAIPLYYFCSGISRQISNNLGSSLYMYLGSSYGTFLTLASLPHLLRLVAAILTDVCPARCFSKDGTSMRRKPYLYMGLASFVLGNCLLSLFSSLDTNYRFYGMFVAVLLSEVGVCLQYVTADAMLVERSRLSGNWLEGARLLVVCTLLFSLGSFFGSLLNIYAFGEGVHRSFWHFPLVDALICVLIFGIFLPHLTDPSVDTELVGLQHLRGTVVYNIKRKSLWVPMLFVLYFSTMDFALFSNMPLLTYFDYSGNGSSIHLTTMLQFGLFAVTSALYLKFVFDRPNPTWHLTIAAYTVLSVLLVFIYIFIRPNYLYASITFVLSNFIEPLENIPIRILVLSLCPQGAEATFMVFLTFFRHDLPLFLGGALVEVLRAFVRTYHVLVVTSLICVLMLFSLYLMKNYFPTSLEHQVQIQKEEEDSEKEGIATDYQAHNNDGDAAVIVPIPDDSERNVV